MRIHTLLFFIMVFIGTSHPQNQKHFMEYSNGDFTVRAVRNDDTTSTTTVHDVHGHVYCQAAINTTDLLFTINECLKNIDVDYKKIKYYELQYIHMFFRLELKDRSMKQ